MTIIEQHEFFVITHCFNYASFNSIVSTRPERIHAIWQLIALFDSNNNMLVNDTCSEEWRNPQIIFIVSLLKIQSLKPFIRHKINFLFAIELIFNFLNGLQERKLKPGSEVRGFWEFFPWPLSFKVYVWNVTNANEVNNGAKPILQETGPYYYEWVNEKLFTLL